MTITFLSYVNTFAWQSPLKPPDVPHRPAGQPPPATPERWRIERDYLDLKQDLGLGHYEGRCWRGFHHHACLAIAGYGFLMARQLQHPESAGKKMRHKAKNLPYPRITSLEAVQSVTSLRLGIAAALLRTKYANPRVFTWAAGVRTNREECCSRPSRLRLPTGEAGARNGWISLDQTRHPFEESS